MSDEHSTTRRTAIKSGLAAVSVAGLAGCTGLLSGSPGQSIEMGDTVESMLTSDAERDPIYDDLADPYHFTLESATEVRITLDSPDFDPYIVVTESGENVGEDDDGGSGLNSDLVAALGSGTFVIWAGSFSGSGTGDYTLSLQEA